MSNAPASSNPKVYECEGPSDCTINCGDKFVLLEDYERVRRRLTELENEPGEKHFQGVLADNRDLADEIERLRAALERIVWWSGCEDNDEYYEEVDAIARSALEAGPPSETTGDTGAIFHKPGCSAITGRLLTCDCGAAENGKGNLS
jgi:hypothetical protein